MADESKKSTTAASETPEFPQVKALRARRENLVWRLEKILPQHENSEEHDIETAKKRTQNGIEEIDRELKRLGASK